MKGGHHLRMFFCDGLIIVVDHQAVRFLIWTPDGAKVLLETRNNLLEGLFVGRMTALSRWVIMQFVNAIREQSCEPPIANTVGHFANELTPLVSS